MSTAEKENLIQIAHTYYPEGQPWEQAWDRAIEWKECDTLIQALQAVFPTDRAARFMQPRMAACVYCILLLESRDLDGRQLLTRIVGAISILAPLYLVYVTKESIDATQPLPPPRAIFSPEGPEKSHASILAQLIEQHLGYRPFPLELANVPLPDIHVDFLHSDQPTLLTAGGRRGAAYG
jgi:hypothetical protein